MTNASAHITDSCLYRNAAVRIGDADRTSVFAELRAGALPLVVAAGILCLANPTPPFVVASCTTYRKSSRIEDTGVVVTDACKDI